MIRDQIYDYLASGGRTWLCVGPMSKNCVDATVELANTYRIPIGLIASRRQIESRELGGGYVENWSTEEFVSYVRQRDAGRFILLARDHGGPWQHPSEQKLNLAAAMDSARKSYKVDVLNGLQLIHIDPSIDPNGAPTVDQLVDRIFELYGYCWDLARSNNLDIAFEIGTEEQTGNCNSTEELEYLLSTVQTRCTKARLPLPLFVVCQTGTRVMEKQNVGTFESDANPQSKNLLFDLLNLCGRFDVLMKEHNTDYLTNASLATHPKIGIHAANVAPEFGVEETKAFVGQLEAAKLFEIRDEFLELAFNSKKWEKWMLEDSNATDMDRSIIAGHYVFATDQFRQLKKEATSIFSKQGLDLDQMLKNAVKSSVLRYLNNFGMISSHDREKDDFASVVPVIS